MKWLGLVGRFLDDPFGLFDRRGIGTLCHLPIDQPSDTQQDSTANGGKRVEQRHLGEPAGLEDHQQESARAGEHVPRVQAALYQQGCRGGVRPPEGDFRHDPRNHAWLRVMQQGDGQ